jgi:hypothetical protein
MTADAMEWKQVHWRHPFERHTGTEEKLRRSASDEAIDEDQAVH